jgi:hypothetical protein
MNKIKYYSKGHPMYVRKIESYTPPTLPILTRLWYVSLMLILLFLLVGFINSAHGQNSINRGSRLVEIGFDKSEPKQSTLFVSTKNTRMQGIKADISETLSSIKIGKAETQINGVTVEHSEFKSVGYGGQKATVKGGDFNYLVVQYESGKVKTVTLFKNPNDFLLFE